MRITLVRPRYFSVWESLACGYIASYLKKYYRGKLEIRFYDGFFDSDKTIIEGSVDSDIVGFSCTSPQMKHALALAQRIKEENPNVLTVFGGHHPSSLPKETLAYPQVDVAVVGEGETAMLDIATFSEDPMVVMRKVVYQASPIPNLDAVPFPDRQLIRQDRTIALTEKNDGERIVSVLSGRGCPFNCVFCTGDHDVFGRKPRKRSVNNVLDEVEQLVRDWRIDFLKFADAEINTSIPWLQTFCSEKIRRNITVPWGANVHAAIMDKATIKYMKKANCREIWVGCETGSPRILKRIGKSVTLKQIENVFRWAKQYGIKRRAYFLVGLPGETREDFELTLKFAEKLDADVLGCTVLCPFPGTKLYNERYADVDWSTADEYGNDFWSTEYASNEELKAWQAEFTERFKDRLCWRQKE